MYAAMCIFNALHQVPHIKQDVNVIRQLTVLWLNKKLSSSMNPGNSLAFLTDVALYTLSWAVESRSQPSQNLTYVCPCLSHYIFSRYVLTKYSYELIKFQFSTACPARPINIG